MQDGLFAIPGDALAAVGPSDGDAAVPSARPTERTLADQLQLHQIEVARRKEILAFTSADVAVLAAARPVIEGHLEAIVAEFYERQTAIEEISLIIGDAETLRRLRAAQREYIRDLFSGFYDAEYVNNRLRIGQVHKRLGVEPKYYLSSIKALKDILRATIKASVEDAQVVAATLEALDKLLHFDTALIFDTYIRSMLLELEAARERAMRYARSLEDKVAERTRELAEMSRVDALTGLLNQRAFVEELRRELARARRNAAPLALVYFDIDGFKSVNDAQGHQRGDELLRAVGRVVASSRRDVDVTARHGGDEFAVLLPATPHEGARLFAMRLTCRLQEEVGVRVSMGIVQTGPEAFDGPDELLRKADQRMYAEKRIHRKRRPAARSAAPEAEAGPD
ncbi:MAG TPA: GGDEF domain-containing protein [Planctomycetota bacterium]|nr:GGDEF domain-containing protein [Planctomycetota bacterium]